MSGNIWVRSWENENMRKIIIVLALLLCAAGCGSAPAETAAEAPAIEDVAAGLAQACGLQAEQSDLKPAEIAKLFSVDASLVQNAVYYSKDADAVAVIETTDPKTVQKDISAYADTLASQSALYTPDQLSKIQKRMIDTEGSYVLFVITDDYDAAKKEIVELFR